MNMDEKQGAEHSDLMRVQRALSGNQQARKEINNAIASIIQFNSQRFCKRFCQQNYLRFRCSLTDRPLSTSADLLLCEWGNASYGWMLDELASEKRLANYRAENGASYFQYCYQIANSTAFYERWKNWRFGRRVYVPAYIESLNEKAPAVFMALQKGDEPELIAQGLGIKTSQVEKLAQLIVIELTKRQKLYLLDTPTMMSLSVQDEDEADREFTDKEIAFDDDSVSFEQEVEKLSAAWQRLTELEQFVLQSMLLEKQDANEVLMAIKAQAEKSTDSQVKKIKDRQSLYYFRRKSFEKLSELANGDSKE